MWAVPRGTQAKSSASAGRRVVELKLQTAGNDEEPFVYGIGQVENRARGPSRKHELTDTDRTPESSARTLKGSIAFSRRVSPAASEPT